MQSITERQAGIKFSIHTLKNPFIGKLNDMAHTREIGGSVPYKLQERSKLFLDNVEPLEKCFAERVAERNCMLFYL